MAEQSNTNNGPIIPHSLDDYFQSTPIGSIDKAIGNNLYGINHEQIPGMVPSNKDVYGFTFFTRPQLNLQSDNLRNERRFYPLLTQNELTIQRFVRMSLDPRLGYGYQFMNDSIPAISCPVLDNQNAFFAVLTNNLNSISGWPDIVAPTFDSKPGLYKEVWSIVDGITRNYESFDIDATFRNTRGDPILYLFYIWIHYASLVFEGRLSPYIDMISENEIDYNTRIYRLVLDRQKDTVTKIAATGPAFPISVPTGSFFDYNNEKPYNDQNKDISIRFRCLGVDYQDDILIKEFNDTVVVFNPAMADNMRSMMVKVGKNVAPMFKNRCYPRIDPKTYQLEWYVAGDTYKARTRSFLEANLATEEKVSGVTFDEGDR